MARSSTTYQPKWKSGETTVVRIPSRIAEPLLQIAMIMDGTSYCEPTDVKETVACYTAPQKPAALAPPINVASVPQLSPFRYPGGKTWLIPTIRTWLNSKPRQPDLFIEPFAGGAIVSLTVAAERMANHVLMAEIEEGVASVWQTILNGQGNWLADHIMNFKLTESSVRKALLNTHDPSLTMKEKAFLTILRNRVQRGGIMAEGAGLIKTGENGRGLTSRWYPETLADRIHGITRNRHLISFYNSDGFTLIEKYSNEADAVFFIDPPYTVAARRLYKNWEVDHQNLFERLSSVKGDFLMTYDNTAEVQALANSFNFDTQPIRMKNTHNAEMTELVIGKDLSCIR